LPKSYAQISSQVKDQHNELQTNVDKT